MSNLDYYFDNMYKNIDSNIKLDSQQRDAILCDSDNMMIIAGAGSGKTTTMASKVKYLIDIKKVRKEEILVISFTNQATKELNERICKQFGYKVDIMTFHKLGLKILKQYGFSFERIIEDPTFFVKQYFYQKRSEPFLKKIYLLCNQPYLPIKYNKKEQTLEQEQLSLTLEYYYDPLERALANFLFFYQITFIHNKKYLYKKDYTPDFTLSSSIYIECFSKVNSKFQKKFQKQKEKIIKIHKKYQTNLFIVEKEEDFLPLLSKLVSCGIIYHKRNALEMRSYLKSVKNYSKYLIEICTNFLKDFKINGNKLVNFSDLQKQYHDEKRLFFLDLMKDIYCFYEEQLHKNNLIDFDDMLLKAIDILDKIKLPYKYVIVDEYQDISKSRFLLIKKMKEQYGVKVIAVGDDFQSIFAFAGSDISLFTDFKEKMGSAVQKKITHTYRNSQELIEVAGNFVMENKKQIKKRLISLKHLEKPIRILVYDSNDIKNRNELLEKTIDEIIAKFGNKKSILLLGRYNFLKKQILEDKHFKKSGIHIIYDKYKDVKIDFLSVHSSKGLGYDNVIILNMEEDIYGFPSKIQDDILKKIGKKEEEMLFAEERRLFYVALTRTKNYTYLLTPLMNPSSFILEILNSNHVYLSNFKIKKIIKKKICPRCGMKLIRSYSLNIPNLYVCTNQKEVCSFKTNDLLLRLPIITCPKCHDGKLIVNKRGKNKFLECTNYLKKCTYQKKLSLFK